MNNGFPKAIFGPYAKDATKEEKDAFIDELIKERNKLFLESGIDLEEKTRIELQEKIKNSILGFVIGDAIGVPLEFSSRETRRQRPILDMVGYGRYNLPAGVWSDDTSMTLATMASIIEKDNIDYNSKI